MKQRAFRILSLVLCLGLCLGLVPARAAEVVDSGTCGENLTWSLNSEGELRIRGTGPMPDFTDYGRSAPWSGYRSSITSAVIEEGITHAGNAAFYYCSEMDSVTLPSTLTSIGDSVFDQCHCLGEIIIPEGVTTIGDGAFAGCISLPRIDIPAEVTSIGKQTFWCCRGLTQIEIPAGVTAIGDYAFNECTGLTRIDLPAGVTTIGDGAFYACTGLTQIDLPKGLTTIGNFAFRECRSLTQVAIPDGVTAIGDGAFFYCESLTQIDIPNGVTTIGEEAFYGCTSLRQINVPDRVTSIGNETFCECTSLSQITIPDGVTSIGAKAFYNCTSLAQINIPDGVTSIGEEAFSYCTSLTQIDIPKGVTSIGDRAFRGTGLTDVTILANTQYGQEVFEDSALERAVIEPGQTEIPYGMFLSCSALREVDIPEGVATIGHCAFSECTSLTRITIPDGVTFLGGFAFLRCTSLTQVDISDGVTTIGNGAFSDCTGLTRIDLPKELRGIGELTFSGVTLDYLYLPASLDDAWNRYSETSAFSGCTIKHVEIQEGRTEITPGLLHGLDMSDLTLPKSVKHIRGGDYGYYLSAIQSNTLSRLSIAGDVETIESGAIDAPNLSSIIFYGAAPEYMPEDACGNDRSKITLWYPAGEPGWTTPTWNGWNTRPFRGGLFLNEARYNDGTMFDHYIKDAETGLGVPQATVTTDIGDVLYTDQDGRVSLPAAISYMSVEKPGYETITHRSFEEEADPSQAQLLGRGGGYREKETTTMRQSSAAAPSLARATATITFVDGHTESREVLDKAWAVERNKIKTLKLYVFPNVGQREKIYSYALSEVNARGVETSIGEENGSAAIDDLYAKNATMEIRAQACTPGRTLRVQIRGLGAAGYTNPVLASQNIGLKLVDSPSQAALTGDSVSLPGLGAGGTVNSGVPFLAGKGISLELPKIPVKVETEFEDGKTKYKVEIGIGKNDDPNGDPKLWNNWKNAVDGLVTRGNAAISGAKAKSFLDSLNKASGGKFGGRDWKLIGGAAPMEVKVAGYLEGELGSTTLSGKIAVIVKAETSMGTNITVMGVPVVLDATLTGELGTAGQLTGAFSNSGLKLQFDGLTVTLELSLELFAGVGVKDVLNAGGYGKGGTEIKLVFNKTQSFFDTWKLQGEWGVKGQVLCFNAQIKLGSGEYWIYDKNNGQWKANEYHKNNKSAQLLSAETLLTDGSNYTVTPRDYLERAPLEDEEQAELFAQQMGTVRSLESSTYPDLQTQVVSAGDATLMVYLRDPGRTARPVDQDRTQLVFRTYNGSSWGSATEVCPSQFADFSPVLYASDGGEIYVAWLRAKGSLADLTDMTAAAGMTEVWTARYDPAQNAFVDARQITDNERYESKLALTIEGGAQCLYWVENSANDAFGLTGTNTVKRAARSESGWTVSELAAVQGTVTALRAGKLDGQAAVAWVEDLDRDLSTHEDQYLRLWVDGAPVTAYTQGQVAGSAIWFAPRLPGETGSALVWYSPEGLQYITAAEGEVKELLGADKSLTQPWEVAVSRDGGKVFVLYSQNSQGAQDREGSDLYAMTYDAAKGAWGEPVAVTDLGEKQYFERPTCAFVGDSQDLVVAFQRVEMSNLSELSTYTNLCWLSVKEVAELEIVGAACPDTGLEPGGAATLEVNVRNAGTVTSTPTAFTLSGCTAAQAESLQIPAIGSGETVTLEVPVTLPDALGAGSQATLTIRDQGGASVNIPLGLADVSLSAEQYVIAGRNMIFLEVTNRGYTPASGRVNVADAGTGAHIDSRGFVQLEPGHTAQFKMETDETFWTEDAETCDLDIRLECEQEQQGYYNDNVAMTITRYHQIEGAGWDLSATAQGLLTGTLHSGEGQPLSGILLCAAYDAAGQQIGVTVKPVSLQSGGEETIRWSKPGAETFKVFLLDNSAGTVKPWLMETVTPK